MLNAGSSTSVTGFEQIEYLPLYHGNALMSEKDKAYGASTKPTHAFCARKYPLYTVPRSNVDVFVL